MLKETVLRAFTSSLLSLLLIATVTWGGCISCKQYFMLPGAKDCCSGKGHCKSKPVKQNSATETKQNSGPECKQIAFGSQKSFALHVDFSATTDMRVGVPVPTAGILAPRADVSLIEPSPPDLQVLHSTFLI
jgi:hypothetical protein